IEDYDITINGNKIGGNAQKRTRDKIFQHGSIPFKFNFNEVINLFKNKPKNLPAPCSLDDFKIKIDLKQLKNIVKSSFEENLNMHLTENDLLIVKNIMKQKEVINV
ncbi:MAG: lipoyl protein ligase domain-containing protein, partial [Elusimicrobiota bacterium]